MSTIDWLGLLFVFTVVIAGGGFACILAFAYGDDWKAHHSLSAKSEPRSDR